MPAVKFGLSSYERAEGDMPELPVINMTAEEAPTEDGGVILQSRPPVVDLASDMGTGPVQQLFQRDLVLGSALFGVSGGKLYRGTEYIGDVEGDGHVSMAGYENFLFVTAGSILYGYDGTTFAPIAFPDDAPVTKVIIGGSRLIAIRGDTGKFYWSDALATDIDSLDFATAESQPDRLLDMLFLDDIVLLFGKETIEFWPNTSSPVLPFQPIEGRVIEKGVRATGCAAAIGSTFAWVTNDNTVCISSEENVISNVGLQVRIAASNTVRLFSFLLDGDEHLCLRLDDETQIWKKRTGLWSEFQSYGQINWVPQCFAGGVFGSSIDGRTMAFGEGHQDLGGVFERRFRGGFPLNSGGIKISSVQLRCNIGQTPDLTGDYVQPKVEMRLSRDAARTFGEWKERSLGAQGKYKTRVRWRAQGMASYPAFLAEFRITAPVSFKVAAVLINEPYGGRA